MHLFRSIRRAALGAAIAGAVTVAVPAVASAASTCKYSATTDVNITDDSGALPLHIASPDGFVTIRDGAGGPRIFCGGDNNIANNKNTNRINVFGPITHSTDGYVIDESVNRLGPGAITEPTGGSEIEVTAFTTGGVRGRLEVLGSSQRDIYRVDSNGFVDLGGDGDGDFSITAGATEIRLAGADGPDVLSGQSIANGLANVRLILDGGPEADSLRGGTASDTIIGGEGNDTLLTVDNKLDPMSGGPGFDRAVVDRFFDVFTDGVEELIQLPAIGRVRLAPAVLKAEAGRTERLTMRWKHPESWRELRKLQMKVYRGEKAVAVVDARPGRSSLSSTGAVELMSGSKLSHHGKWVTAKLALRLPKSLWGNDLRVDVQATDSDGERQIERGAGMIELLR